ncbi:hypothetical protein ABT214_18240, partial [Micromonospora purpureochromogenes]
PLSASARPDTDFWVNRFFQDLGAAVRRGARRYRDWTDGALDALLDLGALTAAGERFAHRMRDTLDSWS